jgi:hypothetical protein
MLRLQQQGAKWTAAPKPQMSDELYNEHWKAEQGTFNVRTLSLSIHAACSNPLIIG